jgi:hypothetical protein
VIAFKKYVINFFLREYIQCKQSTSIDQLTPAAMIIDLSSGRFA